MPVTPLVDLSEFDLDSVAHGKDAVRQACQQRGPFEMLDGVIHIDHERGISIGYKDVGEDEWWAPHHIPGRPIFPGALMIEGCAQLDTFHYYNGAENPGDDFFGFGGLDNTRFRGLIEPGCRMIYVAKLTRARKSMYGFDNQIFVAGKIVFETHLFGIIL